MKRTRWEGRGSGGARAPNPTDTRERRRRWPPRRPTRSKRPGERVDGERGSAGVPRRLAPTPTRRRDAPPTTLEPRRPSPRDPPDDRPERKDGPAARGGGLLLSGGSSLGGPTTRRSGCPGRPPNGEAGARGERPPAPRRRSDPTTRRPSAALPGGRIRSRWRPHSVGCKRRGGRPRPARDHIPPRPRPASL